LAHRGRCGRGRAGPSCSRTISWFGGGPASIHTHPPAAQCRDDRRKASTQVIPGATVEPHAVAIFARDDTEAIVLDFVHP